MKPNFSEACLEIGCDIRTSGWPDSFGASIYRAISAYDHPSDAVNVLSLFSGAGGLDIGFRDAGFKIVESVEIEEKFCETLSLNSGTDKYFHDAKVNCKDIREYHPAFDQIDFIIGGPPCQTFSAAGRRASGVLGTADERGLLFREYGRLLRELHPKGFLFENVYGIVGAQKGRAWKEILRYFSDAGYKLHYRILDAADYGAPQHRERLIIVGLRTGDFKFPAPVFGPDSEEHTPFYSAALAIETAPEDPDGLPPKIGGRYGDLIPEIPPGLNYSYFTEKMGNPKAIFAWRSKFSDFMYKADPEVPVRTVKAQGGQYTGPFHWDNRHFSVAEFKRLQTFPDEYLIAGSRQTQIHQIGNSVPPQLSRILALSVRDQVFGLSNPIPLTYLNEDTELGFRKRKRELSRSYQQKAKQALQNHASSKKLNFDHASYCAVLSQDFDFRAIERMNGGFDIEQSISDNVLRISALQIETCPKADFSICVQPAGKWSFPFLEILASGKGESELAFTAAWKAIEKQLRDAGAKADLVQLSGYYQYVSLIKCDLKIEGLCEYPSALQAIVRGAATRRTLYGPELADLLGVEFGQLGIVAKWLRTLGYEIRNTNTNSQIPKDYWLIPYEFPTLNPLSIQLRKSV